MPKEKGIARGLTLPARASVWYTVSAILERGGALFFTPILTRILTPEEFGIYPLYLSWMGFFTVFATLEISGSVIYRALTRFTDRDAFLSSALGLLTLSSLTVLTVYIIFGERINAITGLTTPLTLFLILQVYFSGIQGIYLSKCRFEYSFRPVIAVNLISALLSPLLTLILIGATPIRAEARIIAPLAVSALTAIPLFSELLEKGRRIFSWAAWKYILRLALPQLPHFLGATLSVQLGRIIIGRAFGEGELAKYSVAFSLGFILSVLTAPIISALSPWISRKLLRSEISAVNTVITRLFTLFSLLSAMMLCIAPEIMGILAPLEYRAAVIAVYPIALSIPFSFLSSVIQSVLTYHERTYLVSAASVAAALVTLFLNLSLTLRLGYFAAAAVLLVSSIVQSGFLLLCLRGVSKKRIVDLKGFLPTAALLLILIPPIFFFRDILAARLILLAAVALTLFLQIDEYREIMREV